MRNSLKQIFQNWTLVGLCCTLVFFLWEMKGEWFYPTTPAEQFQQELQEGFDRKVQKLFLAGEKWITEVNAEWPQQDVSQTEFRIYRNDSLLYYSSGAAFPAMQKIKSWRKTQFPYLYTHLYSSYAAICVGNDTLTYLALLPLKIQYPIRNRYLKNFLFMENPDKWNTEEMPFAPSRLEIVTDPESGKILTLNYSFSNPEMAALAGRSRALPWFFLFCLFFVLWLISALFHWLKSVLWVAIVLTGFLILLRGSLLLSGFPGNWAPGLLFSPRILAINEWNPSAADLFLNLLCLVLVFSIWMRVISVRKLKSFQWLFPLMVLAGGGLTGAFYFHTLGLMAQNSQTLLNPEKYYSFQMGDWLFMGSAALALSLSWIYFYYAGSWYRHLKEVRGNQKILWMFSLLLLGLAWLPNNPVKPFLWVTWCGLAMLAFLQGIKIRLPWKYRLSFLDWVIMLLAMSWVLESSLAALYREKQDLKLIRLSSRFSESRDPLAEYLYEVTVARLQTDEELVRKSGRSGERNRTLSSILLDDYFLPEFKGYSPRLFLYNQYGMRMDEQLELRPLMNPWRPDPSLLVEGKPDIDLYSVPYFENELIDKVYVGRFEFFLPVYGKILGLLELFPKTASSAQIYPRLMLDENVPLQSLPEGFDFAVYLNDRLIRHAGTFDFPLSKPSVEASLMPTAEEGLIRLIRSPTQEKTVILQTSTRTWVDRLISTSALFFFLGVLFLLFRMPDWIREIPRMQIQIGNLLFVQKIRLLLIGFSLIPFLGILFVFRPFIQKSFESDTRENIQNEITQVSQTITQEARVWLRDPGERSNEELKNVLVRARELYGTDMSLYSVTGELIATTQPRVFEMGLASTRMPYNAFVELARHSAPRAIQEEKTGSLTYWSAYHQISGPDQVPVAWLNIPYLSQQEVLDTRIRNFVSTLIQLYLLVLLVLGFLSLTFSRLLTQPLILLRLRMEKIRVGGTYEPIRYNSGDEIGDIIRSYNQMLVRLRESEESLAKTQRESAWKEMARQVAHEIKNPLTPMKLNIQHLIRAWNNRDENWDNLFSRVTKSLLSQIESLSEIAGAFSSFASMPKPTLRRLDLGEIIQNTVALYEQVTEAEITVDLPTQAIPIFADEDQLSRALQNLVKNALQSIENPPGFVKVIVLPQDSTVEIRIQDSGSGIPEEIQSKVFQPNFSTKTSGMGLGLAMVKRTVESVGGSIRFETQEGIGTTFILEFPLALETE